MTRKTEGGKGDLPRPIPNRAQYEANWERAFGVQEMPGEARGPVSEGPAPEAEAIA